MGKSESNKKKNTRRKRERAIECERGEMHAQFSLWSHGQSCQECSQTPYFVGKNSFHRFGRLFFALLAVFVLFCYFLLFILFHRFFFHLLFISLCNGALFLKLVVFTYTFKLHSFSTTIRMQFQFLVATKHSMPLQCERGKLKNPLSRFSRFIPLLFFFSCPITLHSSAHNRNNGEKLYEFSFAKWILTFHRSDGNGNIRTGKKESYRNVLFFALLVQYKNRRRSETKNYGGNAIDLSLIQSKYYLMKEIW